MSDTQQALCRAHGEDIRANKIRSIDTERRVSEVEEKQDDVRERLKAQEGASTRQDSRLGEHDAAIAENTAGRVKLMETVKGNRWWLTTVVIIVGALVAIIDTFAGG